MLGEEGERRNRLKDWMQGICVKGASPMLTKAVRLCTKRCVGKGWLWCTAPRGYEALNAEMMPFTFQFTCS